MPHVKPSRAMIHPSMGGGERAAFGAAHSGGRPHAAGTVLAEEMKRRRILVSQVAHAMGCSDRQVHNYLTRARPLRLQQIGPLCDLMDMDPEELIDEERFLVLVVGEQLGDAGAES